MSYDAENLSLMRNLRFASDMLDKRTAERDALAKENEALARNAARCQVMMDEANSRVDALAKALRELVNDMAEDTSQRHHADKYRVYQVSPEAFRQAFVALVDVDMRAEGLSGE
jgi:hypothetical protein